MCVSVYLNLLRIYDDYYYHHHSSSVCYNSIVHMGVFLFFSELLAYNTNYIRLYIQKMLSTM